MKTLIAFSILVAFGSSSFGATQECMNAINSVAYFAKYVGASEARIEGFNVNRMTRMEEVAGQNIVDQAKKNLEDAIRAAHSLCR